MAAKKAAHRSREERREDALRPSAFLGYDRDTLAVYFIEKGAFPLAEMQLKRAVWLNPFEAAFKNHLAVCLLRQKKFPEARRWARQALEQKDDPETRSLLRLIEREEEAAAE